MLRFWFALSTIVWCAGLAVADPAPKLAVSPAEAMRKIARVEGRKPEVSKDLLELFEDAKDGKFDRFTFADACLIAGGVVDPRDRQTYRDKLHNIEADVRKATTGSKSVAEDAARLLRYLHAGPMSKGYKLEQTDLHVLLDTGEFNCVSSVALYTVMARKLGIDIRAVAIPGHVFSVLAMRDRKVDVETTSPYGFDVEPKRTVGPVKIDRSSDKRREVGEPGLAAVLAYNHGVIHSRQKRFAESLRANFLAIGLDPSSSSAIENAVADLVNWPIELSKERKFEDAVAVLAVAREIAPSVDVLVNNTRAIYDAWASDAMKRKDWSEAIRVYEKGLRQLPDDKHITNNLAFCRAQVRR